MSQNLPRRSLGDILSLRHSNHFVIAGANNRNVIITYRFLAARELLECLLGISPSGRNPCRGNKAKTIEPLGINKRDELQLYCISFIFLLSCLFKVATPNHVILCNFRSLFYFIYISVNSWYLNKPDEDWYWPVEISQLNSILRCLISTCKSLPDCNVFNIPYYLSGLSWVNFFPTTFSKEL